MTHTTEPDSAEALLLMVAEIAGQYSWESLSEHQHHSMTVSRRADILAAYRSFCAFRDGRMSLSEALTEAQAIHKRALPQRYPQPKTGATP